MPAIKDIAWVAGLLEGEGCFSSNKGQPCIQINMVDLDTIEKIRGIINPNIKICIIEKPNKQVQYKITVGGSLAIQWMMTIYSLMSKRRQMKIKETFDNWEITTRTGIIRSNIERIAKAQGISKLEAKEVLRRLIQ